VGTVSRTPSIIKKLEKQKQKQVAAERRTRLLIQESIRADPLTNKEMKKKLQDDADAAFTQKLALALQAPRLDDKIQGLYMLVV
jgi:hypothetical protein